MLQKLDGHTKGPYSYSGPIGSLLFHCEQLTVVKFKPIKTVLPLVNEHELSTDQKYLYKITKAIGDGVVPQNLAEKSPGKMGHSRWLTTANRILRVYVATNDPPENLIILAEFVTKVYSRMWFQLEAQPQLENGARHLWKLIHVSKELPNHVTVIINKVIQDNAYFAHPENLLTSMLTDTSTN